MTRRLRVRPEAEAEIEAAVQWYEGNRPGLGVEFMAAPDAAFDDLLAAPEAAALWVPEHPFPKYTLRRFPYAIFFTVLPDALDIVAVAHAKRRPGYWVGR